MSKYVCVRRALSMSVCIIILLSSTIVFPYAAENARMSIADFNRELSTMLNHGTNYNSVIMVESQVGDETVIEETVSTNRLIVSTNSNQYLANNYGAISRIEGYNNWHIFQYRSYNEAELAYNAFSELDEINYVEFDKVITCETETTNTSRKTSPLSWGAEYVRSQEANRLLSSVSLDEVIVGVIDTGIDDKHTFFISDNDDGRILEGNRLNDNIPYKDHGTHVAGIIVDNTLPNVKIKSYNYFYYTDAQYMGTFTSLAAEINNAVNDGVDVINMSLGGFSLLFKSSMIVEEIESATQSGVVVVASAGNEYMGAEWCFPANDVNVITVSASCP